MHATNRTCFQAVLLLAAVFAGAAFVTATPAAAGDADATRASAKPSSRASMIGVATGETVNGIPVYRMPPIAVTASRKVELARIAREDAMARAKRDRANVAPTTSATRSAPVTLAAHAVQK